MLTTVARKMVSPFSKRSARRSHARRRSGKRTPPRASRLLIETLEGRLCLSTFALGTSSLLYGPGAGSGSDIVASVGAWNATANAEWLHTTASGTGNGLAKFTFDANTGATRTGTLTIGSQTLTVTQAGAGYVAASAAATVVSTGLNSPQDVAVGPTCQRPPADEINPATGVRDTAPDVYIADTGNNAIKVWRPMTQMVTTLPWLTPATISNVAPLSGPQGVWVDNVGNVFVADTNHNTIKEKHTWDDEGFNLVSTGLSSPQGVTRDSLGNFYIADTGNNAIKVWNTYSFSTLPQPFITTGLNQPMAVAVDAANNLYIADTGNNAVKMWNAATQTLSTLVSTGLNQPMGVKVDGAGDVYIADTGNNAIKVWSAATETVTTLVSSGLNQPMGLAVDSSGNVFIADTGNNALKELPRAFIPTATFTEQASATSDQASLPVLPTTLAMAGVLAPTSDQPWLTPGTTIGGYVSFGFSQNTTAAARTGHITVFGQSYTVTQAAGPATIATTSLAEGKTSGTDAVIVTASGAWTAAANASWLHMTTANGTGSGLAKFTFDTNSGATRTGTLTIAGQTLTVTQAGSTYAATTGFYSNAYGFSILANLSTGQSKALSEVAVDVAGNLYCVVDDGSVRKWDPTAQILSTLVSSGLNNARGLAVDGVGNVYIADTYNNAIKKWTAATKTVSTLISSGLSRPYDVAVDAAGNLYLIDYNTSANTYSVKKWTAATQTLSTLVSSGLNGATSLAVDAAGNVYIADTGNNAVKKWDVNTQAVSTISSGIGGLTGPTDVAVDASGNVYIPNTQYNSQTYTNESVISKINVATGQTSTLYSDNKTALTRVTVDNAGNVYAIRTASQTAGNGFYKMRPDYVPTGLTINAPAAGASGTLSLPLVSASLALVGYVQPTFTAAVLSMPPVSGGQMSYSLAANTGPAGSGTITVLGQTVATVNHAAGQAVLAANSLVEGPAAGSDSVELISYRSAYGSTWTATANASWLHTSSTSANPGVVKFTFDANTGATRTGTLTVGGATITVTQAAAGYVAAGVVTLTSAGLNSPEDLATDSAGPESRII
jgi:DNA-binding beta-propeller fold protein YncE